MVEFSRGSLRTVLPSFWACLPHVSITGNPANIDCFMLPIKLSIKLGVMLDRKNWLISYLFYFGFYFPCLQNVLGGRLVVIL